MNSFAEVIAYIIAGLVLICVSSVIGGTILWLVWEDSLGAMFPKAIENGILASKLTWWQAVKITWITNILIKSINQINDKSKKN